MLYSNSMDIVQTEWSQIFGRFLIWGIILFVLFTIIRFGFPYLMRNKKKSNQWLKYFRLIELFIWLFFFSWFLFRFAEAKSLFAFVIFGIQLGILYLIFRFWLTDLIAGIIFKHSNQIDIGDSIHYEGHAGKIIKIGGRSIEIENEEGNSVFIPYRKVTSAIFSKTESATQSSGFTFELETSLDGDIDITTEKIKTYIVALPWSSIRKSPIISLKGRSNNSILFSITVYSIDRSFFSKIENQVRNKFST